jgi:hypothetical protein
MSTLVQSLVCIGCNKTPEELTEYVIAAMATRTTPGEYVLRQEGTLNTANGHFACDRCYIEMGMPSGSGRNRWVAP